MKRSVAIYIRFNDNDANLAHKFKIESYTKDWIEHRMEIFNQYTRVSLENQTNQEFLALLRIHPDSKVLIQEALKKYAPLSSNIIFTADPKKLIADYSKDAEELYLTHIDSDDMYDPDLVQVMHDSQPKKETAVLICQKGYILEHSTGALAHYNNKSPSVFTQIFKTEDYIDVYQHFLDLSHVIMSTLPYEPVKENMFIIVAHDHNTYTKANPYYKYTITDEEERKRIIKQFKLCQ